MSSVAEFRALALPLRVGADGQIERKDAVDALCDLMGSMAGTTAGTWPHARWFGLHEVILGARLELQDQSVLADAYNRAFTELGIDWARVHEIRTSPLTEEEIRAKMRRQDVRRFDVTLMVDGKPVFRGLNG
jgi:hypothetical protein